MKKVIKRSGVNGFIDHPGSAAVVGHKKDLVLLIRIQREGVPFETYEISGGVVEEDENHEQATHIIEMDAKVHRPMM